MAKSGFIGKANLKWKKHSIKVQVAQESFLTRLHKERQASANTTALKPVNTESNVSDQNLPKDNSGLNKKRKEEINTINNSDESHRDSNFTKKDSGRQQNGTIEFTSEDEHESFENSTNQTKINSRKVYHSSSDEEVETKPSARMRSICNTTTKLLDLG